RVLAVMGMVCAGFLAFILFTSGPFARTLPAFPVEGRDLNPLLLGNNVLLMAAMLVVLLGTLLPLVHKQLGLGSISVGEPFF
ncbi:cytochrome c-type biogenesis CcmF C-terminal domain-containing protein, partial [Salmonella enterica]|uniref:cytochrome c-type biogenesis CcmF C-terminal domain-containing protein n=1 Tax=Salmonella enterica TaxID=28901 RepID=UPI00296B3EEE